MVMQTHSQLYQRFFRNLHENLENFSGHIFSTWSPEYLKFCYFQVSRKMCKAGNNYIYSFPLKWFSHSLISWQWIIRKQYVIFSENTNNFLISVSSAISSKFAGFTDDFGFRVVSFVLANKLLGIIFTYMRLVNAPINF